MKILAAILPLTLSLAFYSQAQRDAEPVLTSQSEILSSKSVSLNRTAEVSLTHIASATGTSWQQKGSEAAVVTIFVDGNYHQDVILFAGGNAKRFPYEVFIGELGKGDHKFDVVLNGKHSSAKIGLVSISDLRIGSASLDSFPRPSLNVRKDSLDNINFDQFTTDFIARSNAPFIYARPNSIDKFSDIPLIVYYEIFNEPSGIKRIRYSVIFSHEDGGTKGKALMARWGRMTDIEWIYEIKINQKGEKISEIYQGANHETLTFQGKRAFGSHPIFLTATDNNNFSDTGCSSLRFAPDAIRADLSNGSRETLMEKFPWTYRIMSEEVIREGRVGNNAADADTIFDPREYSFIEVFAEQQNSSVSVELDMAGGKTVASDVGNPLLRVNRTGYFRIAVHGPSPDFPSAINVRCHAVDSSTEGSCRNVRVIKIVKLNKEFSPYEQIFTSIPKLITAGETVVFGRR
jgi:hypothetical protein